MRKLAPLFMALVGGCQSLAVHPEIDHLTPITAPTATVSRVDVELNRVLQTGNKYLDLAKGFTTEDKLSGGSLLVSGLYAAVTTAFNPAPDNLKAALLLAGASQAWRTSLRPAERAKIYVQGYRGMDCTYAAASPLALALTSTAAVRDELDTFREEAASERRSAVVEATLQDAAGKALVARLDAQIAKLADVDEKVRLEEGAAIDAPYRVARVRRQIEDTIEKRLAQVAPDYAGALKLIGETAKPAPATSQEAGKAAAPQPPGVTPKERLTELVERLEREVPRLAESVPTQASDAYERMADCVASLG
ncbi:MAG: hypothetical protein PSX37_02170 [bacterium]|nr:hypothetical protein [bacterium]